MFVSIDKHYACELQDPRNFSSLKLVVDHPSSQGVAVASALADIGGALDDPYAWIPTDWMRQRPGLAGDAGWQRDLQNMLDYASRKGWVDEARGRVRAHIEWHDAAG